MYLIKQAYQHKKILQMNRDKNTEIKKVFFTWSTLLMEMKVIY